MISVIVPIYNDEFFLDKCIQSILGQTYTDLQIILVNDGSTDASGSICDKYAMKDRRIQVVHQTHKGVSAARNVGLMVATGEFIGFIDADDWCEPRLYESLLDAIARNSADVARCNFQKIYNNRVVARIVVPPKGNTITGREAIIDSIHYSRCSGFGPMIWNSLFRTTNITIPEPILFDTDISYGEDWEWMARVLIRCNSVVLIPDVLYDYNKMNPISATSTSDSRDAVKNNHIKIAFLTDNQFPENDIESLKASLARNLIGVEIENYISSGTQSMNGISLFSDVLLPGKISLGKLKFVITVIMIKLHMPPRIVGKIWRMHRK